MESESDTRKRQSKNARTNQDLVQKTEFSKATKVSGWSSSLVPHHSLPKFLRDNEYLLHNHRPPLYSTTECLKSIFRLHTETWNIWTHLAGCIAFITLTVYIVTRPSVEVELQEKLSFSPFLAGAIFCLGCSSIYHCMLCHSEKVAKFCSKLDYIGVITLIVSSFFPWIYFGFYCHLSLKMLYLSLVGVLGFVSMIVVCQDKFGTAPYRPLRAGLFIALGLTGAFPAFHYLFLEGFWHAVQFASWLVFMALMYISGGIIYALRVPEKILPGKFDIIGQSHQIMHLCVLAGTFSCYQGVCKLAEYRLTDQTCLLNDALEM